MDILSCPFVIDDVKYLWVLFAIAVLSTCYPHSVCLYENISCLMGICVDIEKY